MTFAIHGLNVSRGVAIGRAVLVASSRVDVEHYFVSAEQVASWNGVSPQARFQPGQTIIVMQPVSAKSSTRAAKAAAPTKRAEAKAKPAKKE